MLRARDPARGVVLADRLRPAHSHWTRLKGLIGTRELPAGEGLWLKPCQQVHMLGMQYPLDIVFLDEGHRIVRIVKRLGPWRVSPRVGEAASVIELPAGTADRLGLEPGSALDIAGEGALPAASASANIGPYLCNLALAALFGFFLAAHVDAGRKTGQWGTLTPIILQEALLVVLFLVRRVSVANSHRPWDWTVGILGTFLPFALRPTATLFPLWRVGQVLQICALTLSMTAVAFLGRSIGIVAANRGVKTAGPYAVVRHPMYAAHVVQFLGYVLSYPAPTNVLVVLVTVFALTARARAEERFLAADPAYAAYLRRVRWRLIPYVY